MGIPDELPSRMGVTACALQNPAYRPTGIYFFIMDACVFGTGLLNVIVGTYVDNITMFLYSQIMQDSKPSQVIYFCHGIPGSAHDIAFIQDSLPSGVEVIAPNLLDVEGDPKEACVQQFDEMTAGRDQAAIHVIGFSIGTMAAAHIAGARADKVAKLTFVSAAAPLGLGDFLPKTAGAPVFKVAQFKPRLLKFLIAFQGLFFRIGPALLLNRLFAKCGVKEKELIEKPEVSGVLRAGLANSLVKHPDTYGAYLKAYVSDWSAVLTGIRCPTELWHGSADTWSPIEMVYAIKEALPTDGQLHIVEGAEHYSTLQALRL
ncbi:Alpha/beta hydrolase family protein [Pseudovibrio axinellae]|uniref:Alpha/beta hydrolase family protein n=2 Tax=Pseudovibrio axinellae TaxID=989403 RepID=A0A161XHV2_9HYPH|nr:Alpha/beta hydrolase family protein [Pseudovibrio axinellae]SER07405.1 Pimeloyl-ACP methyl ester carboxylesterase [Pseudovibrio axinellae]